MDYYLKVLANGEGTVLRASRYGTLSIIAGAGATVTVSRVDTRHSETHITGASQFTVAATSMGSIGVDWPFYYVTTAGGPARISLIPAPGGLA
jgi:hypothetical protein